MQLRTFTLLLSLLPLLGSCGLFESRAERALRASPDFQAGYNDGCGSAGTEGADKRKDSMTRDEEAYANNKAYRAGWGTGFNACRVNQLPSNQPGADDRGPIADPNPGSP